MSDNNTPTLTGADASLLGHYVNGPWIFDAMSVLKEVHVMADRGLLINCDQTSAKFELTQAGRTALWEYTKEQNPQTQRDVGALRQALATVRRAVQGTSNDSEMDSLREALELALVRVPRNDAATIHDEIDALAEQDSNDGEIDGLRAVLKGVLRYWPEIDLAAS